MEKIGAHTQRNLVPLLKIAAVYVLLVISITLMPEKISQEMVRENGPVEVLSAAGYFLFCLFLFYFNYIGAVRTRFAPGFFIFLLGLRELDFHARFTTMGMFKSRFFVSPEVPVVEKFLVTLFIISLLTYGIIYLRGSLPRFKKDVSRARPYAVSIACAVGCILVSKSLDGNSIIFKTLLPMLENPATFARTVEECLELFIPILFIRALLLYCRESVQRRRKIHALSN